MNIAIYGIGIVATILLFTAGISYNSHKTIFKWLIISAFVAYIFSFVLFSFNEINSELKLKVPIFSEGIEDFTFSLGERGISVSGSKERLEETHYTKAFEFNGYYPVELYIEKDILYADVNIYGGYGLPPIKIKRNKLFNKPVNWDFNSNETAMEIVDENNFPIYQFFYKTPSHIVLNGIIPFSEGFILANENGAIFTLIIPDSFKLKRIFKYPSWKYPGEIEK